MAAASVKVSLTAIVPTPESSKCACRRKLFTDSVSQHDESARIKKPTVALRGGWRDKKVKPTSDARL